MYGAGIGWPVDLRSEKGGVDGHEVSNELLMGFKGYKFVGGVWNT